MRRILFFALNLFLALQASAITLSDSAQVSLLTCGPGDELYAKFGHTAIRVKDPANQIDISFNYGYFNYNVDGFYYKFVKGETDYQLGICETQEFILEYTLRRINMWEQVLNLTSAEKQRLFDALMDNYQPENRFYRYNFVFDNCATRPRDMIAKVIGGKIVFDPGLEKNKETFQQLIDEYTRDTPAILFGIHLIFGSQKNTDATLQQTFFLPERLMQAYATAKIVRDSVTVPLVLSTAQPVFIPERKIDTAFNYIAVLAILLLIGSMAMAYTDRKKQKHSLWFDGILFGLAGIAGCIVCYLNFFSVHPLVSHNWNALWLNPLLLLFAIGILFKKTRSCAFRLQYLFLACELFVLTGSLYLPQKFLLTEILLMITLAIRSALYVSFPTRIVPEKQQNVQ
jgi:hypothetical protein